MRDAIMKQERKVFSHAPSQNETEFWAKHGVTLVEEQENIEALRVRKMLKIKQSFLAWRSYKATLVSSLGFKVDSNERANTDINGLLVAYENNKDAQIVFRDADNQFHNLSYAQLKVLQLEIIENGNYAYAQKWDLEQKVANASSHEELSAIRVEFLGKDFTQAEG